MTDNERRKIGREVKAIMTVGDKVCTRSDGRLAYGDVETIGNKVKVRWLTYVPVIDGHRHRSKAFDPSRFIAEEKHGCKWRLMPLRREED